MHAAVIKMRNPIVTAEIKPLKGEHRSDAESQEKLIQNAFESGDPRHIAHALGIIARARGMTEVSRSAGVSRRALYKALSKDGDPRLSTLTGVLSALGVKISISIAEPPSAA